MSTGDVGGFAHAPLTKLLCIGCCWTSVGLLSLGGKASSMPFLLASVLSFRSPGEFVFGALLLYYTRVFERRRGSSTHSSALLASTGLAIAMQLAVSTAMGRPTAFSIPIAVIFSNFAAFLVDIPAVSQFEMLGQLFSDKMFTLLAGAQLLYLSRDYAMAPAICSLVAGAVHRSNLLGIGNFRVPEAVATAFRNTLGYLLHTPPPQQRVARSNQSGPGAGPSGAGQQAAAVDGLATPQVSQAALEQLQSMGFNALQAEQALQQSGNDVQLAMALLLSEQQT